VLHSPFHNNFAKGHSIYVSKWGLQNESMRQLRSANCLH
jgi:hypothetical protein